MEPAEGIYRLRTCYSNEIPLPVLLKYVPKSRRQPVDNDRFERNSVDLPVGHGQYSRQIDVTQVKRVKVTTLKKEIVEILFDQGARGLGYNREINTPIQNVSLIWPIVS